MIPILGGYPASEVFFDLKIELSEMLMQNVRFCETICFLPDTEIFQSHCELAESPSLDIFLDDPWLFLTPQTLDGGGFCSEFENRRCI